MDHSEQKSDQFFVADLFFEKDLPLVNMSDEWPDYYSVQQIKTLTYHHSTTNPTMIILDYDNTLTKRTSDKEIFSPAIIQALRACKIADIRLCIATARGDKSSYQANRSLRDSGIDNLFEYIAYNDHASSKAGMLNMIINKHGEDITYYFIDDKEIHCRHARQLPKLKHSTYQTNSLDHTIVLINVILAKQEKATLQPPFLTCFAGIAPAFEKALECTAFETHDAQEQKQGTVQSTPSSPAPQVQAHNPRHSFLTCFAGRKIDHHTSLISSLP